MIKGARSPADPTPTPSTHTGLGSVAKSRMYIKVHLGTAALSCPFRTELPINTNLTASG